eukprot:gene29489-33142_t
MIHSIVSNINAGNLPIDPNGIYTVIFRGDFNYAGWMTFWCGYHDSFVHASGDKIRFIVIGDPSTNENNLMNSPDMASQPCSAAPPPTVNGNFGADSMVNVLAHELAETITNWDQNGWYFDED